MPPQEPAQEPFIATFAKSLNEHRGSAMLSFSRFELREKEHGGKVSVSSEEELDSSGRDLRIAGFCAERLLDDLESGARTTCAREGLGRGEERPGVWVRRGAEPLQGLHRFLTFGRASIEQHFGGVGSAAGLMQLHEPQGFCSSSRVFRLKLQL